MYVRYRNFNSSNSSCIMASVIALDNETHEAEYRTRWYNLTAGQPAECVVPGTSVTVFVSSCVPSVQCSEVRYNDSAASACVLRCPKLSSNSGKFAGEPASTRVVHSTWRRSIVRTASVARASPGAKETRGATYNGGYCLPSGGSPTRPMIPAAAASLLRRTPDRGYVTAETLPAHYFPDSSTVMWDDRV
ncbi:hypothetical protein HPB50_021380 [Hyalomma asiaticum]|uniref:Uncharacterized protein n=1 Tax=Hyalomma asiaticum TaxID=266040 RepID=A0ACB7T0P5_HYAAI|nr:hypothetical protein HPB50_021380 [Hyalomma asiaticum]